MLRTIAVCRGDIRIICIPCLVLIALFAISAALYAAPEVNSSSTPQSTSVGGADTALSTDQSPTADSPLSDGEVSDGPLQVAPLDLGDRIGDRHKPGFITVDLIQPDLKAVPRQLVEAGLLLIPLDKAFANAIPRTTAGRSSDGITEAVSKLGSAPVLLATLSGMYALGDNDDKQTAKLALAAVVNATLITEGAKTLTGRGRPNIIEDAGEFEGPRMGKGFNSFPSGHTSAVFAVATVLANRHPKQKWLYYGMATAVGFARVRKSAHFPSDVLVGAGIGIYAGNDALRNGPRVFSIKF